MARYGLIGEKLGHSYSKPVHEALADYTYDLIPLSKEEFDGFMREKDFAAINVTIPYKKAVLPYLSHLDANAGAIGAVNTIVNRDGALYGYNTDYSGFLYTLKKHGVRVAGKKVLVLGNGGAAQAVLAAVRSLSPKELVVVKYKAEPGVCTYEEAAARHTDAGLIINASPVGMYPDTGVSPIDLTPYGSLSAVIDLIYNPLTTAFMAQAEKKGVPAVNGLEMLIAQAKYAVEYFLDTKIDDTKIEEIYMQMTKGEWHGSYFH